ALPPGPPAVPRGPRPASRGRARRGGLRPQRARRRGEQRRCGSGFSSRGVLSSRRAGRAPPHRGPPWPVGLGLRFALRVVEAGGRVVLVREEPEVALV